MEPDWDYIGETLMSLTMRELRPIGKRWFNGMLGGASAKAEYVGTMVDQMRNWWRRCAEQGGQDCVRNVLRDVEEAKRRHA